MKATKLILIMALLCTLSIDGFSQADSTKVSRITLLNAIRKIQADSVRIDTTHAITVNTDSVTDTVATVVTNVTSTIPERLVLVKDTLVCNAQTTSFVIFVYNPFAQYDKPYAITYTKDGMLLEVYCEDIVICRKKFEYDGITFKKLINLVNMQQLVSVLPHGKIVSGADCTTFSVYQNGLCYFIANDNSGVLNVKGSFEPLILYMKNLIPNLQTIIENCEGEAPNSGK